MSDWGNNYRPGSAKPTKKPCPESDLSGACEYHHPSSVEHADAIAELRAFLDGMRKLLEVRREPVGLHAFEQRLAALDALLAEREQLLEYYEHIDNFEDNCPVCIAAQACAEAHAAAELAGEEKG